MMSMKRSIQKVAVLGAGVMGARIACHFANANTQVVLLDIPSATGTHKNQWVDKQLETAIKSKPNPLYHKSFRSRIHTGNFEEHMKEIGDCDWIIEVITEDITLKNELFNQVERYKKEGALVSSNTSGIPIHLLAKGRSEDFQQHFCGTHFFNPPRYLPLLEIIPTVQTSPEVTDFLSYYATIHLGKQTVLCKDTPAFIANRIGIYAILSVVRVAKDLGFSIAETDALTGSLIGRPRSATFRTLDVVGLDVFVKVADYLHGVLTEKKAFLLPDFVRSMHEKGLLGEKVAKGFYQKTKAVGKKSIQQINLSTYEYSAYEKPHFQEIERLKEQPLAERMKAVFQLTGKTGDLYRRTFFQLWHYSLCCVPEISDSPYHIDKALCAGFGWEMGPFETLDALGITVKDFEDQQLSVPDWYQRMQQKGFFPFYTYADDTDNHDKPTHDEKRCYTPQQHTHTAVATAHDFLYLPTHKEKVVYANDSCTLHDIGDGVVNLSFHSKMNTLNAAIIMGIQSSLQKAQEDFCALTITHESDNFSAGADLSLLYGHIVEQDYDEIDLMVRQFQQIMLQIRQAPLPVVAGTSGMVLGGGCELILHADHTVAHAESYIGLVEVGVGLIPAGGGTKEMAARLSGRLSAEDTVLNSLLESFKNLAMGTVSTSAHEAMDLHYVREKDTLVMHKDQLLQTAKQVALSLHAKGYTSPAVPSTYVQGKTGMAFLETVITNMLYGKFISEHDALIARKLSYVMNGGALSSPVAVSEAYLLELEREAFLSLCTTQKTIERIHHLLFHKKILRN